MRLLLTSLLVLGCGLSACDSAAPDGPTNPDAVPTPQDSRSAFQVMGAPSRLDVEATSPSSLDLFALFGLGNPRNLVVRATVSGTGVSVQYRGYDLDVTAALNASAILSLTAKADGYRDTTLAIPVRGIAGICPPEPSAGSRDYFPLTPGTTSSYQYVYDHNSTHSGPTRYKSEGMLKVTTGSDAVCIRGTRSIPVTYTYEGTDTVSDNTTSYPPSPHSAALEGIVAEDSTNAVTLHLLLAKSGMGDSSVDVTFTRYGAPGSPDERVATQTFSPYAVCTDSFHFRDSAGLQSADRTSCYYGFGVYESWSLIRIPGT